MIHKITASLRDGSFPAKAREKIALAPYQLFTRNRNAALILRQCVVSDHLRREFRDILENAGECGYDSRPSNRVWVCWLQGCQNAPALVKACCHSLESSLPDRELIFLTEENLSNYVRLPEYIMEKYRHGIISRAHYSDLIRVFLLCEYGGLWVDSTVLCTSPDMADFLSTQPLFAFKQFDLSRADESPVVASNWLISAYPNHCIFTLTRDLLYAYWKKYSYLRDYFIFHLFFALAVRRYPEMWEAVPAFNNHSPHTMQFELHTPYREERWKQILKMSDFHKLNHHTKYETNHTIYGHILEEYGCGGGVDF